MTEQEWAIKMSLRYSKAQGIMELLEVLTDDGRV